MTISANRVGKYRPSGKMLRDFVVYSGSVIYDHVLCALTVNGELYPLIDGGEPATDPLALFVGVSVCPGGAVTGDGSVTCQVDIGGAEILVGHDTGSLAAANIGDSVYSGTDEGSVDDVTGSGDDIPVGVITEAASASTCWVKCRAYGIQS